MSRYLMSVPYRSLLAIVMLCDAARAQTYQTSFANVTWDDTSWTLQTTYADQGHYQARASLANGYIGINLAALGPFFEVDTPVDDDNINGWPLFDRRQTFATISGFYDIQATTNGTNFEWLNALGGESVISGIPHWAGLVVAVNDHVLNASTDSSQISDFTSSFDFRRAVLFWNFTWTPPSMPPLNVEYAMFVHKLHVNQAAIRLVLTSAETISVRVIDVLHGDGAVRTTFLGKAFVPSSATIWTAVQPQGIPYVSGFVYSTLSGNFSDRSYETSTQYQGHNSSGIAQSILVTLQPNTTSIVEKHVGIASSDAFSDPQTIARNASLSGASQGFSAMLTSHASEWQSIVRRDSVDSFRDAAGMLPNDKNILEQQILAITNPFFMLQNTVGPNAVAASNNNTKLTTHSIAVAGLSSDSYAGLIFWDVEVWMQPGLVVAFPESTRQVANYRTSRYEVAKANIQEKYITSQNGTVFSPEAAIFPWTSGRFGNCTGTGPCFDYEYHINGDIALELENYYITTGDASTFHDSYFPVYNSMAQVYSDLLYLNQTSDTYMLLNATDPDEYANHVNNPGYTMVLVKTILTRANKFRARFGMPINTTWIEQARKIEIPTDKNASIYLEYTGMNGTISVKQADVVLVDDFLDYPNPYTLSDLDFYAGRQSINGPGMTYGVFSIIAAEASPSGCSAYTYALYGSQPYVRAPWFQFSEQLLDDYSANGGTHPAYPFLTGMGGANRVTVFGFLGLRLQEGVLNINPMLPPQISQLSYRTFYWQGHAINATANATHTILERLPSRGLVSADQRYAQTAIPVTIGTNGTTIHNLTTGYPLIVANRVQGSVKTVPGNVAQCLTATSNQRFAPGQFPLSAIDGAVSTKWQPIASNVSSTLTVLLGTSNYQLVTGFSFDWAQAPPRSWAVAFSNASDPSSYSDMVQIARSDNVSISTPFAPDNIAKILPYMSNVTKYSLPRPMWSGQWAILTIEGSHTDDFNNGSGATVAEWAILARVV